MPRGRRSGGDIWNDSGTGSAIRSPRIQLAADGDQPERLKDAAEKLDFGSGFGVHAGIAPGNTLGLVANYDRNTLGFSASTQRAVSRPRSSGLRVSVGPSSYLLGGKQARNPGR